MAKAADEAPTEPPPDPSNPWADPQPGQKCEIYGQCSEKQKEECYRVADHCLMLDEEYDIRELEKLDPVELGKQHERKKK